MSLPVEIVFGVYLGVITGIVPALVAGTLGFVFKYVTDVTIPGLGVVVLSLAIAGVNGGLLALNDETIRSSERAPAILTAIVVVLMISLYAHAQGDRLGASAPKRISLKQLRDRTLSTDVIELVGGRGRVSVEVAGEVTDIEGYPPLPADTRAAILDGDWTFPADLPLAELEDRFAERLRTEFDLADVSVRIDEQARATVSAAPPTGALSKRVPAGKRAVSVSALVPTGIARGDVVRVITPDIGVEGAVIAAQSSGKPEPGAGAASTVVPPAGDDADSEDFRTDGGETDVPSPPAATAPTTTGGEGRVTLAVDRSEATDLLRADRGRVLVLSRGTRREYELTALLRRAGKRFRKVTVAAGGPLDGHTIGEAEVREAYDVAVLAARHGSWRVAPDGTQPLSAGDDLFVVGSRDALDRFAEVAA
ncbi:TrkA-C domain-containing protein [Halorubrum ezzemoulense]|uniref:Potassium transporter TrkA n=1 Tax=Halorubrum ezzemoulense TaxID=337243 RepID=A0A238WFH0_HALEZ|nr:MULTISPECIES: TrkA C-terminal domain-containing protein [Halorubrum]OYR63988.1 potassium transporter TrkA [Halorubrum ezzemoulense]TKX40639.1 potassium transporter TrkA [Halorubrum sp. CGM4_25_10-8A]TKX67271.1 potassium transporter TrkA [Halorubrum sp. GN12_10-3_MGM]SNR45178.1 TrkA-C domain-containing protein [Halorubrum ezzemoulense]